MISPATQPSSASKLTDEVSEISMGATSTISSDASSQAVFNLRPPSISDTLTFASFSLMTELKFTWGEKGLYELLYSAKGHI